MNSSYVLQFRDVQIDVLARIVTVSGDEVHLTRTEFDLLRALADHPRLALGRTQLLTLVWGGSWRADYHLLSVHMSNLRRKIGDRTRVPPLIQTIHGFGYRFDAEAVRADGVAGADLVGESALHVTPSIRSAIPPRRDHRTVDASRVTPDRSGSRGGDRH